MVSSNNNRSDSIELLPSPISSTKNSRKSSPTSDDKDRAKKRKSSRISNEQERINKKAKYPPNKKQSQQLNKFLNHLNGKSGKSDNNNLSKGLNLKEFIEPTLSEPVPTVTGFPLGSGPSQKIKRERLWNAKKGRRGRAPKNPIVTEDESSDDEAQLVPIVNKYKLELKTKVNEKLQKPSSIRYAANPVPKKGADIYQLLSHNSKDKHANDDDDILSTPKKKRREDFDLEKDDSKRKIKNASPKKARRNAFGFETHPDPSDKRDSAPDFADKTKDNDDYCSSCGEPGIFLCCESCPKSFHFACCDPPFYEENLPDEEWFCNECTAKRNPPKLSNSGMFGKLLDQIPLRNPIQFKLPKRLRERFEGVVTGSFGEYEDTDYKPFNPSQVYSFDQTDPALHFDKEGNPKICVKCGESGIQPNKANGAVDKLIIQCEYCPSAWHLDCLSPPLSTVKQLGTKWKCPNHADHLIANKQRKLKKPTVFDVDKTRGYKNNGQIEIKSDDEVSDDKESDDSDEDSDDDVQDIPTPPQLQNQDTEHGVSAILPPKAAKLWTDPFAIPRLPAKGVVLDFIGKCIDQKEVERRKIDEIFELARENNLLLSSIGNKYDDKEQQTIKSLVELKELDFTQLLEIANKESSNQTSNNDELNSDEIEELKQIRELMKLKGKNKLLDFLKSEV